MGFREVMMKRSPVLLLVALVLALGLIHGLYATSRKVKTTV